MLNNTISVVLFCGGRGGSAIIRELMRHSNIQLSLLVNAYDDGLSTGALRNFIPGMLGPSDFRKNLSYLIDPYSAEQVALTQILEYRLNKAAGNQEELGLAEWAKNPDQLKGLSPQIQEMVKQLDEKKSRIIREYLKLFFNYYEVETREKNRPFNYDDCSLGNLIFAGAYLKNQSFNLASKDLAQSFGSRARLECHPR